MNVSMQCSTVLEHLDTHTHTHTHTHTQAQFFDEDSDDVSTTSEVSPLVRKPPDQDKPAHHVHIVTGYLSAVEAIALVRNGLIIGHCTGEEWVNHRALYWWGMG